MALTRRRFLSVSAAVSAGLALPGAAAPPLAFWRGNALGASASIRISGLSEEEAAPVFAAVEDELNRLEAIFSLYRAESAISLFNRQGRLAAPPAELLELLSLADTIHRLTFGAFDPTVQPLWQAHASAARTGQELSADRREEARSRIGWAGLYFGTDQLSARIPGMAITLNGIAQGFITDRIAALLRDLGLSDLLVDMGEIRSLGRGREGHPWQVGISDPEGEVLRRVTLSDRALATSSPDGMRIGPRGPGHILAPRDDREPERGLVSVSAPTAALADGLSTALCLLDHDRARAAIAELPDARIEVFL